MSNPAVFELAMADIARQRICLEDNIGESIHLHIGLVRLDMTVKEFQRTALTLQRALNTLMPNLSTLGKFFNRQVAANRSIEFMRVEPFVYGFDHFASHVFFNQCLVGFLRHSCYLLTDLRRRHFARNDPRFYFCQFVEYHLCFRLILKFLSAKNLFLFLNLRRGGLETLFPLLFSFQSLACMLAFEIIGCNRAVNS